MLLDLFLRIDERYNAMISYHDQRANAQKHAEAAKHIGQPLVGDPAPKVAGNRSESLAQAHADALARRNRG